MSTANTTIRTYWRQALVFGVVVLMSLGGLLQAHIARAALSVPQVLTYQARLTDASRITVDNATLAMQFTLYTALSGGSCVYVAGGTCGTPTTVSVAVADGIFTVPIGDGTLTNAFTDEIFDDNTALYLEVAIAGETLTPRRQLTSSAYAMQAGDSDLLDSLNSDNDGCTAGCIVAGNASGNVVITGDPQSSVASGASLYINPATPSANEVIFGIANGGVEKLSIDEDGDISTVGSITVGDSVNQISLSVENTAATTSDVFVLGASALTSGSALKIIAATGANAIYVDVGNVLLDDDLEVNGLLNADGDVDLGDATGDTVTVTGRFDSSLVPSVTATNDLGTNALRWQDLYIGTNTLHLGSAIGDELALSYSTAGNTLDFVVGAAGTTDFQITDDGHVGFSNTAAVAGSTIIFTDTYNGAGGADQTRNGFLSTLTFSNNTVAAGTHTYNGSKTTITADGIDNDTTVNGTHTNITLTNTAPVSLDNERIYGTNNSLNVLDGTSKFDGMHLFQGSTSYTGGASSSAWRGVNNSLYVDGGSIVDARGFSTEITANDGSITTAFGGHVTIQDTGTGAITDAVGLNLDVSGATDSNIALYAGQGYVHIDGAVFSGGPAIAPTFGDGVGLNPDIGDNGTLFVKSGIEIHNGALCVGGATSCASALTTTGGQIYADGAINANNFDVAEMFQASDYLLAGEIVTIDLDKRETVKRADPGSMILGAVSTEPGLVLGWGGDNQYPIALAGRVPVKVSNENGPIAVGDRVTLSSTAGVGMRANKAGGILGVAMQASNGSANDAIVVFIKPQYWNGDLNDQPSVTAQTPSPIVQTNNVLVVNNNVLSNIARLDGIEWSVNEDGVFTTKGSYDIKTLGHQNKDVVTHAISGLEQYITIVGTSNIENGSVIVEFEKIDPEFNDVIEAGTPIYVTATMSNGSGSVYVTEKSMNGFTLNRERGTGTEVDWSVTAYRKGYAPEEKAVEVVEEEGVVEDIIDDDIAEVVSDVPVVAPVVPVVELAPTPVVPATVPVVEPVSTPVVDPAVLEASPVVVQELAPTLVIVPVEATE